MAQPHQEGKFREKRFDNRMERARLHIANGDTDSAIELVEDQLQALKDLRREQNASPKDDRSVAEALRRVSSNALSIFREVDPELVERLNAPSVGQSMEALVQEMLEHMLPMTMDEHGMGIDETPRRVARMWLEEFTGGYNIDVEDLFRLFPDEGYRGIVTVRDIPVRSVCVHHLVPIVGYAHIGYIPDGYVIGLSKLPRIVDAFSRRLQIQENLTEQITKAIDNHLQPAGVIVVISAEHMCMTVRGVQAPGTRTVTCEVAGAFQNKQSLKDEFFTVINGKSA